MNKIFSSFLATLLLASGAIFAQPSPATHAKPEVVPVLKGINLVEGKDKKRQTVDVKASVRHAAGAAAAKH